MEPLKKPSQFYQSTSEDEDGITLLKSPAMFLKSTSNETIAPIMKTPSDFTLDANILPSVQNKIPTQLDTHLENDKGCKHESSSIGEVDSDMPRFNTIPTHKKVDTNYQSELQRQQQEIICLKKNIEDKEVKWQDINKKLTEKLERSGQEILDLKQYIKDADTQKFMETKSIYEKYFFLQSKYDRNKTELEEKILLYKQIAHKASKEKEDAMKLSLSKEEENIKLKQFINEKELETNVFKVTYEKQLLHSRTTYETLNEESIQDKEELHQLKGKYKQLQADIDAKSLCVQDLEAGMNNQENSTKILSEIIESQKIKINDLEEKLERHSSQSNIDKNILLEKNKDIQQLNELLKAFNVKQELTNTELARVKTAYDHVKQNHAKVEEYEQTCEILQSTNRQLNVRVNTLNEMIKMQECTLDGIPSTSHTNKLLMMWRQKVYQLLVLLKSKE